jgi:hypothetical protein
MLVGVGVFGVVEKISGMVIIPVLIGLYLHNLGQPLAV